MFQFAWFRDAPGHHSQEQLHKESGGGRLGRNASPLWIWIQLYLGTLTNYYNHTYAGVCFDNSDMMIYSIQEDAGKGERWKNKGITYKIKEKLHGHHDQSGQSQWM